MKCPKQTPVKKRITIYLDYRYSAEVSKSSICTNKPIVQPSLLPQKTPLSQFNSLIPTLR